VIPARDEAPVIARALNHFSSRIIPARSASCSSMTTAVTIPPRKPRAAAASVGAATGLTIVEAGPVPVGWTGKLWACIRVLRSPRESRPDYLLLTDADIVHGRVSLRELVARAESGGYGLVSLMVRLNCRRPLGTPADPGFCVLFLQIVPAALVADLRRRTAAAAGGCMLVRRETLDRVGGIASIRRRDQSMIAPWPGASKRPGRCGLAPPPTPTAFGNTTPGGRSGT